MVKDIKTLISWERKIIFLWKEKSQPVPQMTNFEKLSFCSRGNIVRVELVYMQYNVSDSQALFWCFLLILRMDSLDTFLLCSLGQQAWLCMFLACSWGFYIYKKECTLLFLQFYQSFNVSYIEIVVHFVLRQIFVH